DWANIGYPIAECAGDGSFVLSKPDSTGGLVTPAVIAEQMLYEVGDPTRYVLPDVTADFSEVRIEEAGPDRVRVTGALGQPPPAAYKVSATHVDGWRAFGTLSVIGIDADRKAQRTAEAILERTRAIFRHRN
ncbi:acyclic terpene utilization AtuA family protein, partial [Rhizobiaceae sp. 2RAB30]